MAGRKRPRCTATAKSTGEQCQRRAAPGGKVCPSHGGNAPQVAAAAERRAALREATLLAARVGVVIDPEDPYEGAAAAMRQSRQLAQRLGVAVSALPDSELRYEHDRAGEQQRSELTAYQRSVTDLGQLSAAFIRLGLDERLVSLAETASTLATAVILAALGRLDLTDAQRADALAAADEEFGRQAAMLGA